MSRTFGLICIALATQLSLSAFADQLPAPSCTMTGKGGEKVQITFQSARWDEVQLGHAKIPSTSPCYLGKNERFPALQIGACGLGNSDMLLSVITRGDDEVGEDNAGRPYLLTVVDSVYLSPFVTPKARVMAAARASAEGRYSVVSIECKTNAN